jgi:hypothetical protein
MALTEWEEREARKARERENADRIARILREDARVREEIANSRPPLPEWSLQEIFDGYSSGANHHYSHDELDAELARRFGITDLEGRAVRDALYERGLIDRTTWELITDYWDSGCL